MKTLTLVATAISVALSVPAAAAPIILYNTGVDDTGAQLADGAVDTHYSTSGRVPGSPFVYSNGAYVNVADAKFIAIRADGGYTVPNNVFSISFFLTDLTNAQVSGFFAADNAGTVSLNGIAGASTGSFNTLTPFGFTSGFSVGLNTLNFSVQDFGPPSALLVSGLSGSAGATGAVPEPATWAMMLLGFGMAGFGLRRRQSKVTTRVAFA